MEPPEETVAPGQDSVLAGLAQLLGGLAPGAVRRLGRELADRLAKAPLRLNEYGYDPYGFHPESARTLMLPGALAHRHWFRVENHGIERVPSGRVILIDKPAVLEAADRAKIAVVGVES